LNIWWLVVAAAAAHPALEQVAARVVYCLARPLLRRDHPLPLQSARVARALVLPGEVQAVTILFSARSPQSVAVAAAVLEI
jgi:hypothetical protein